MRASEPQITSVREPCVVVTGATSPPLSAPERGAAKSRKRKRDPAPARPQSARQVRKTEGRYHALEKRVHWLSNLTPAQQAAVDSLLETLALQTNGGLHPWRALSSDAALARFLKAHKWKVKNAHDAYNKMIEWRRATNRDACLCEYRAAPKLQRAVDRAINQFWTGLDNFGRPCYFELYGSHDFDHMIEALDGDMDPWVEWQVSMVGGGGGGERG